MLIVFGMFAAGTASLVIREISHRWRNANREGGRSTVGESESNER
jgi:hypothetical protein